MRLSLILLGALALAGCNRGDMAMNASNASAEDVAMDANMAADMNMAYTQSSNTLDDIGHSIENASGNVAQNQSAAADGSEYCEVIQDRVPASECAYYREAWARLETGRGALDLPEGGLALNVPATVSFALARPESAARPGAVTDPGQLLDTAPEQAGTVRVGRRMAVRLSGEGFTIDPPGLIEKDLASAGAARWDWRVTPTQSGRRRLTVSAYVIVQPPGGPRGENLMRTLSQEVEVGVTREQRARDMVEKSKSWLELLTGWLGALAAFIGVGIFGVVVAIRKFRKNKAGRDSADGGEDGDSP